MRKINKTFVIILLLMISVIFTNVKSYANPLPIESLEGASIRTDGIQGLRFDAKVLDFTGIVEKGFYLLKDAATIADLEESLTTMLYNGKTIFKVPVAGVSASNEFSIVLTGIPEHGYLDKITVIPYAELNNEMIIYALPVTRSIGQVAINMDQAGIPLPQGVEDVLDVLSNYRKSRIWMDGDMLELSKGVTSGTSYVNLDDYIFYPTNITTITLPIPARTGYTFDGWYDNYTMTGSPIVSVLASSITGQKSYYSDWTIIQYTVTFDSNGGSAVAPQTVNHGNKANAPTTPTKANHFFKGWFLNGGLFNFNTPITSNITLVAGWHVQYYSYNFLDGGDSNNSDYTIVDIDTNVSYANDNPSGTAETTPWRASYADLSRTDGTRIGGKQASTIGFEPTASIATQFTFAEAVTKVEILGIYKFGTPNNVGYIYLQTYNPETRTWETEDSQQILGTTTTIIFDADLFIKAGTFIRIAIDLKPSNVDSGLHFTGIKVYFKGF